MFNLEDEECLTLFRVLWKQSITGYALVKEDGYFLAVNPSFCRITEYTEAELKKKRFQDITDPDDLEADEEMAKLVAAGEYESYDMTKAYITKTKKLIPILLRVTGVRTNGKFIYFVGEIAPIDRPVPRALPEGMAGRVRRIAFYQFIKDYWAQITAGCGATAWIVTKIVMAVRGGQ